MEKLTRKEYDAMVKKLDEQIAPKPYFLIGASQYDKFRLNPKQYFSDLAKAIMNN